MKIRILAIIGFFCGVIPQLHSQGYIVLNGVYPGNVSIHEIDVLQNPTNSDYTGFFLIPQGKTQPAFCTNTFSFLPIWMKVSAFFWCHRTNRSACNPFWRTATLNCWIGTAMCLRTPPLSTSGFTQDTLLQTESTAIPCLAGPN